jgi:hypothetical protein
MAKWAPLGVIICLCCSSLLVTGGYAAGDSRPVVQQSIRGSQGATPTAAPTYVLVWLNTTETFAFSSGKLTLFILANGTGTLIVNMTNADGAITPVTNATVAFTASTLIYEVWFTSTWGALPGTFSLQVSAWYVNVTNGNSLDLVLSRTVNVRLALGQTLGVPILLAIIAIAIITVIKLRKPASKDKVEADKTTSSAEGSAVASGMPNKIHCPECKKLIDEGSVFCAECGARVPEFLRYNAPQA